MVRGYAKRIRRRSSDVNTEVDDGDVRVSVRVPASIIGKVDAAARQIGRAHV